MWLTPEPAPSSAVRVSVGEAYQPFWIGGLSVAVVTGGVVSCTIVMSELLTSKKTFPIASTLIRAWPAAAVTAREAHVEPRRRRVAGKRRAGVRRGRQEVHEALPHRDRHRRGDRPLRARAGVSIGVVREDVPHLREHAGRVRRQVILV